MKGRGYRATLVAVFGGPCAFQVEKKGCRQHELGSLGFHPLV